MTFITRPEIVGTIGVAATTHWLASSSAMSILERGGNAFDAATAAAFVHHVCEPHLCGPAGDVPIIFHRAGTGETKVLCGQGVAPERATLKHYRGEGLDLIPGTGLLAAVVPGAVPAWLTLLRDFGTLRLAEVLEPAIHYATTGCPVVTNMADALESVVDVFVRDWPTSAELWLDRSGRPPAAGSLYRNRPLGATYRRLVSEAESSGKGRSAQIDTAIRAWSQGFVAETIDTYLAKAEVRDVSGDRHRAVLSGADLARWSPSYEDPVSYDYFGHTVNKCGPWSQGPVFLQQLAILEGFDLDSLGPTSPDLVHVVVEAAKLAFADREAFYADPDFVDVPIDELLSESYNSERRDLVGSEASQELRPGVIGGAGQPVDYQAALDRRERYRSGGGAGEPTVGGDRQPVAVGPVAGDTVHLDIIDRWGNMVSATPSGGWLQSSPAVPGLGFALGTRAQMFWLDDTHPNRLEPGKRPRTTLTPGLALRDGEPYLAFGTPGGEGQDQWALTFFIRHVHSGLNLQEAIDAPAFHTDHWPSSFWPRAAKAGRVVVEDRFSTDAINDLVSWGHDVKVAGPWSEGRLCAASRTVDGTLRAGANPRGAQNYAVGR